MQTILDQFKTFLNQIIDEHTQDMSEQEIIVLGSELASIVGNTISNRRNQNIQDKEIIEQLKQALNDGAKDYIAIKNNNHCGLGKYR